MKILQVNCSESVFRFHTIEPKEVQKILQAIASEVDNKYPEEKKQIVPLYDKVEMYDTGWNGELTYSGNVRDKYKSQIDKIWSDRDKKVITPEEATKKNGEIEEKMRKEIYPKSLITSCAGLGDNDAVVTLNKKGGYFTLNIGNNDISDNNTKWVETVKGMGIQAEEADCDEKLAKLARDCTCGITYGFGGPDERYHNEKTGNWEWMTKYKWDKKSKEWK